MQDELQACNETGTISFFSVLLAASAEMKPTMKHEVALEYMEKRVSIAATWKRSFRRASNQFRRSETQLTNAEEGRRRAANPAAVDDIIRAAETGFQAAEEILRNLEVDFQNQQMPMTDLPEDDANSVPALVQPNRRRSTWFGRLSFTVFKFFTKLISEFRQLWAKAPKNTTHLSTDYYFSNPIRGVR